MPIIADYTYYTGGGKTKLQSIASPYEETSAILDSLIEAGGINQSLLNELTADKITAGTLVVRDGTKAAKLLVKNAAGTDVVTLNESGITVEEGNIVVKNADGETTFDASGLVSNTNFFFDSVTDASVRTSTSTTFVDIPNTSISFSNERNSNYLFLVGGIFYPSIIGTGDMYSCILALNIDGVLYPDSVNGFSYVEIASYASSFANASGLTAMVNLSAGDHIAKLQWKFIISAGNPTPAVRSTSLSYLKLGT